MTICLVCDDHELVREALAASLARSIPDCEVIVAHDYPSAWDQTARQPDLCVCDLMMPGSDPLLGIENLQALAPNMNIVVLTAANDDELMWQLVRAGIAAFVRKSESGRVLHSVVGLVLSGGRYLPERILEIVTRKKVDIDVAIKTSHVKGLTRQQSKVLNLISRGQTNKEIARELSVAPSTVKFHVDLLLRRFEARNRTEILKRALEAGLELTT